MGACLTVKQLSLIPGTGINRAVRAAATLATDDSVTVLFEPAAHGSDHHIRGALGLEERDAA